MQTASSETESKSLDLNICVHHYTLRAPCPKGQGKRANTRYFWEQRPKQLVWPLGQILSGLVSD